MKFKDLHINVKLRLIIGFFQRLFNQMIIPFIAIYLSSYYGAEAAGIMSLLIIIVSIGASFYGGHIADIMGRKPILLITEIGNFIIFLIMALANSPWFTAPLITYFLFMLNSIFTNLGKPAVDAIIVDVTTPETRKFVYTLNYWSINIAFGVGAMIGAFFYESYFFQILLFAAFSTMIIFFVYLIFIKESMPNVEEQRKMNRADYNFLTIIKSYIPVIKDKIFLRFLLFMTIMMGIEFQLAYYISVRLSESFFSEEPFYFINLDFDITGVQMYGILRTVNTVGIVILALIIERYLKRLSNLPRIYIGIILFTLGYAFLGSSNLFWILIFAVIILTIGELMYVPISQSVLSIIVDDNARTKYMALYGLHFRFGTIIASVSITVGAFLTPFGMSTLYIIMGIMAILLFVSVISDAEIKEKMKQLE